MYKKFIKYKKKNKILENKILGGNIYNLNGSRIKEPTTLKQSFGLFAQKQLINFGLDLLPTTKFTKSICKKMGDNNKLSDIIKFANNYNIDYKTIDGCSNEQNIISCLKQSKINTMNDFFIRKRSGLPNIDFTSHDILSPVDCYATMFENESSAKQLWIKGKLFTLNRLFNRSISFTNYGVIVFRLAPHHYHRFHCPVNGRIISINKIGNKFLSVQPSIVNSSDVYTENVRLIITIKCLNGSMLYMAIIGATCIGSIVINNFDIIEKYNKFYKTDLKIISFNDIDIDKITDLNIFLSENIINITQNIDLGYFQYGGTTIVCAYDNNKFNKSCTIGTLIYDRTLIGQHETELKVGDKVLVNNQEIL